MSNLGTAIAITSEAFKDRTDKGGKPYILHCLHVMNKLKYENDEDLMMAAVLHDIVEDTDYDLNDLRELGFNERVVTLVMLLTHWPDQDYQEYIERIKKNADATKIKIQDLRHNSDITRIKGLREKDFKRIEKYHNAYNFLCS